jgi:glycyl-tRNA synthetase beta chain
MDKPMDQLGQTEDLLIEIGCEELPAKNLKKIESAFTENIAALLKAADLSFSAIQGFATPRRLAVRIVALTTHQPFRTTLKRGPAKAVAFDDQGNPTKATLKFAESCGVDYSILSVQETDKGAWLVFEQVLSGSAAALLIPGIVTEVLKTLPVGRRMRWGNLEHTFARPIHWIVLLLGNTAITSEIFGIKTSHLSYGHRFHYPHAIPITSPQSYEELLLNKGFVIADFNKRRTAIVSMIEQQLKPLQYQAILNVELLDEVTGLVEWPVVLLGEFEAAFLQIPKEVLITAMQNHQKCFAVADLTQFLLNKFIITSNIQSLNPSKVIAGNECVMHARLADAAFYYQKDKEQSLEQRRSGLKHIRFQQGLGSLWDKSERIARLATIITEEIKVDPASVERAALLCKSDLLTEMVGEFPELQGTMGRYYALENQEPPKVAIIIEEHYHPRFSQDSLPATFEGCAVALADRIDSLVGLFGLGHHPTGDKDPFALRRQALAILRILIEKQLDLDLRFLLETANKLYLELYPEAALANDVVEQVLDFCFERLRAWYQDQNISTRIFEAVLAKRTTTPLDFHQRIQAVSQFMALKEASTLITANKRVRNILSKDETLIPNTLIETALLIEEAEKALATALSHKEKELAPLLQAGCYTEALKTLAMLAEPIDQFFTQVMVITEDLKVRHNRLKLLYGLRLLFLEIADISLL